MKASPPYWKAVSQRFDGNADGNRIPPQHTVSRQTSLKSGILHRIPPYPAQRIGLRIRRSQVRVLPSAPRKSCDLQEKREAEIKGRSPARSETPARSVRTRYAASAKPSSGTPWPVFSRYQSAHILRWQNSPGEHQHKSTRGFSSFSALFFSS